MTIFSPNILKRLLLAIALGLGLTPTLMGALRGGFPAVYAQGGTGTTRVATTGADAPGCGSETTPCRTIQYAVDHASPGEEILIAAGVYTEVSHIPSLDTSIFTAIQVAAIIKSLTLRGGYTITNWTTPDPVANPTTLDAQGQGRVLYVTGPISATIEGLRITGGDATSLGGPFEYDNFGGGVFITETDIHTVTLKNNWIFSNTVFPSDDYGGGYGGGVSILSSAVQLNNNQIYSNTAKYDGGVDVIWSAVTFNDNRIFDNLAESGGGVTLIESEATFNHNTIDGNAATSVEPYGGDGGGILAMESTATLDGNNILENVASNDGAGVSLYASNITFTNNIIADNSFVNISVLTSTVRLLHTTIVDSGDIDGIGIDVLFDEWLGVTSRIILSNTIVAGHGAGIYNEGGGVVTMTATLWGTDIWANGADWLAEGDGIITTSLDYWGDPDFVDPVNGDYHIGPNSFAIDRGINAGVTTDIDDDSRPSGWGYDIGADEVVSSTPGLSITKSATPTAALLGQPITYTLNIMANNAGLTFTNLIITDAIPSGASYIGGGTRIGDVVSWTVPSLPSGMAVQTEFVVTATQTITNSNYRVQASEGYSATGSASVTTFIGTDIPIVGLTAINDSPTPLGYTTTFSAAINAGSNAVYTWDFGDGTNSSGIVVSHTYLAVGAYGAVVTASNTVNLLTATTTSIVEQAVTNLIATNNSPITLGQVTLLTATIAAGDNVSYTWDFGDGTNGSGALTTHTYAVGSYTATVTAQNSVSIVTATTQITIVDVPITGLTAANDSPTIQGWATNLIANVATGSNVTFAWNFGDGQIGNGANTSHIYSAVPNTYTAIVTASNMAGFLTTTTTIVVNQTCWTRLNDNPTDYVTLQDAIDASTQITDVVKVAGYCATLNNYGPQIGSITKTLTVRGGYTTTNWTTSDIESNQTVLDAHRQGRVLHISGNITATIEGLRITRGNANNLGGYSSGWDSGSGVYAINATLIFRDNYVYDNNLSNFGSRGGGFFLRNVTATLEANVISNNQTNFGGGGVYADHSSQVMMIENVVTDNRSVSPAASAGGLSFDRSFVTLRNNTISENEQGVSLALSTGTINGNIINANYDYGAPAVYLSASDVSLSNNIIFDNENLSSISYPQFDSSALYSKGSTVRLNHNTFAQNKGGYGTALLVGTDNNTPDSAVIMSNTILVSHTVGIYIVAGSQVTATNTLWGSGAWANGNDFEGPGLIGTANDYAGNPDFIDPDNGNYHLGYNSFAIDRGINAGVTTDIDGDIRPFGLGYDIGADEVTVNIADLTISKSVTPVNAAPGETVVYTIDFSNIGRGIATGVVITDSIPLSIAVQSVISSGDVAITQTQIGAVFETAPILAGQGGLITITGVLSDLLSHGYICTNTATITATTVDSDTSNNRASAAITIDAEAPASPILLSPANGTVTATTHLSLTWAANAEAAGYLLDFNGAVSDVGDVTAFDTGLLADGVYTWTVAAYDALNNTSPYTDVWSFEIVPEYHIHLPIVMKH